MENILVTGGSGFCGGDLVGGLLERKYRVRVLDVEDFKSPEAASTKASVEYTKGDIRDEETLMRACKEIDCVFHYAAMLPISRSTKKAFWKVNVDGTRNVLKAALRSKVKKIVFISSCAVYGIPKELPITENTKFNPVCDYGRSKIEAERVCDEYRTKGLDVVILRPQIVVGGGRLGLFQILYSWIADNKNIYIIGRGDNLFQFLSERDLTNACILSMKKSCKNETFNLGAERFKSVRENLQELINYAKSFSKIVSLPEKAAGNVLKILDRLGLSPLTSWHYMTAGKSFYFDVSKSKNILDWRPELSNTDMMRDGYDWYIFHRKDVDGNFGVTHKKSVKQRILRIVKSLS